MTSQGPPVRPLRPDQEGAAAAPMGPVIIEGGGGTGKTHTVAARIAIALKGGMSPDRIACFTPSTGGGWDIRDRVALFLDGYAAARGFFSGTFQRFALQLLRTGGAEVLGRSPAISVWQRDETIDFIVHRLGGNRRNRKGVHDEARRILDWRRLNQGRLPDQRLPPDRREWTDIMDGYEEELVAGNGVDWGNVVLLANDAMGRDPQFRNAVGPDRYSLLLVDDCQDIVPSEYTLARSLTGRERSITIAVGPNQSVRMAEGADDRLAEIFRLDHPGVNNRRFQLVINHRATQELGKSLTRLVSSPSLGCLTGEGERHAFLRSGLRVGGRPAPMEAPVLRTFEGRAADMYRHIIDGIGELEGRGYASGDIAIIYQDDDVLDAMRPLLLGRGIPYTVLGRRPVDRDRDRDVRCITGLLRCLLNPRDYSAFRSAACIGPQLEWNGLDPDVAMDLRRMASTENISVVQAARRQGANPLIEADVRAGLRFFADALDELRNMSRDPSVNAHDLCSRAASLLEDAQGPLHPPGKSFPVTDLLERARIFSIVARGRPAQHNLERELTRFLDHIDGEMGDQPLAPEPGSPFPRGQRLTLAHVDAARGLEWPVVWAVDMSDHILPGAAAMRDERLMRQAQRRFYVLVTRARNQLIFCHLIRSGPTQDTKPSPFLEPIGDLLRHETVPAPTPRR